MSSFSLHHEPLAGSGDYTTCLNMHCIALHCVALHCVVLGCVALYYIVSHRIVLKERRKEGRVEGDLAKERREIGRMDGRDTEGVT